MKNERQIFWILISLLVFSLFWRLNSYPLYMEEPRRAIIALEMYFSGDWLAPTINGEPYYRKPPLYNWMIAGFFTLFKSTDEWVVRLTSVLSLLGLGLVHFNISKKLFSKRLAMWSTLVLLTFGDLYLYFSRLGEMDVFFSLLMYPVVILPFYYLKQGRSWLLYTVPFFLTGLGFLAKGLPAFAFLGISFLVPIIAQKSWRRLYDPRLILSLVALAVPIGLYAIAYSQQGDLEQFWNVLFSESADRAGSNVSDILWHLVTFPLDTLKNLLPFSLLLFFIKKSVFKHPVVRVLAFLFLVNYVIYWIVPGGRGRYVYPLFPLAAIILAFIAFEGKEKLMSVLQGKAGKWLNRIVLIAGFFVLILALPPWFNSYWVFMIAAVAYFVFARFFFQKWQILNVWLPFAFLIYLRLCVDIGNPLLVQERIHEEKDIAAQIVDEFSTETFYYNTGIEQHYTFLYELTRNKEAVLKRNNEFTDPDGCYFLLKRYKPEGKFKVLKEFDLDRDTYLILRPDAS